MTAPVPEQNDEKPLDVDTPPGEHHDELPDASDRDGGGAAAEENAETSEDQPST